jgi:hypothetical protein
MLSDSQLELFAARFCRPMDDKGTIPRQEGVDARHDRAPAKEQ